MVVVVVVVVVVVSWLVGWLAGWLFGWLVCDEGEEQERVTKGYEYDNRNIIYLLALSLFGINGILKNLLIQFLNEWTVSPSFHHQGGLLS